MKFQLRKILFLLGGLGLVFMGLSCDSLPWKEKKEPLKKPWRESPKSPTTTVPWKGQAVAADTFIKISRLADLGVVNIGTTRIIKRQRRHPFFFGPKGQSPFDDFFGQDLFRHFFGDLEDPPEIKRPSLGSGFVLNEEGYIVTNNHVIEKADEIRVTIGKDREYEATVVGSDPKTDVAVIKIKPKEKLHPLVLGDSDKLQVGEIVVAIGNPFGLSHTVTQGIVSAKERTIGFGPYDNFIQTDASINPGNSGGPLLNLKAEVVGINAAIVASGQGIGFAIPVNLAKNIITQLKDTGSVTRGWLGVYIQKVDLDLAKSLGLKKPYGALVSSIQKESPAEKAGIKPGDVILKVEGKEIQGYGELPRKIASTSVGKKITLEILRDGQKITVYPVIGKLESDEVRAKSGQEKKQREESSPAKPDKLGLTVQTLNPETTRQLGIDSNTKGVLVGKVSPSGPAYDKGVRRGDVIIEVNKKKTPHLKVYRRVLKSLKKGNVVLLLIKRSGDATLFIAFTL